MTEHTTLGCLGAHTGCGALCDLLPCVVARASRDALVFRRSTLPHPLWQVEGSEVCLFVKDQAGA
jgi:hypothetical protein